MYRTNLVLKGVNKANGFGKISIEVTFQTGSTRERTYISTGEKIPIESWQNGSISKSFPSAREVMKRIEIMHNDVKSILFDLERKNGFVSKKLFNDTFLGNSDHEQDLLTHLKKFIEVKRLSSKGKLVEKLVAIQNQLKVYLKGKKLNINEVNQEFINSLTKYWVQELGLQPNTVAKNFAFLRQFMNFLKNEEILTSLKYQKLDYPSEVETNTIVLTKLEVVKLIHYAPKTYSESKVRDLFLVLIYTGLRFGDAVRISKSWVRGEFLFINTQKTGEKISIPLHPKLKEVLEKYEYDLTPLRISNQKFNDYVKDLCKEAGITDLIEIVKYEKGVKKYLTFPKCQLIASHTGRRTFITNAILAGIPLPVIQKITGHRKLTTLQRYVEIADENKKTELEKFSKYFQ